jgi:hypothetical protein
LESAAKKSKMDPNDTDDDLDVTVQAGLYAAEMFASNPGVNYLVNLIIIGGFVRLSRLVAILPNLFQTI